MTSHQSWGVSLCLAAILIQAGCSSDSAATPTPTAPEPVAAATGKKTPAGGGGSSTVLLPEGTLLAVRTTSTLSSKTQTAGQTFSANLEDSLLQDGRAIAAKGARVEGKIVAVDDGGRVKGLASMTVELTGLQVGSHFIYISTNTITQSAGTTKRNDAVKIGIGAGVGAAIGAIAGGGKGAAIGAAAGGAAGTGVVLATRGEDAVIPSESLLNFTLRAPVTVTVASR